MSTEVQTSADITPPRSSPAPEPRAVRPAHSRPRLMLVDDNDAFLSAMELLLPRLFDVDIAASVTSGQEALEALAATDIDLAIVDYKMPGLNGLTFARRARTERHWTRILLVTFNPSARLEEDARDSGADGVINKAEIQSDLQEYLPRWFGCGGG